MEYYLVVNAMINGSSAQTIMATAAQLVTQQNATTINLLLSTPGGEVSAGIAIFNFLKSLPVIVNTHNIGNVDSIGNAIFLAGKSRKTCPNSTFMFHGVGLQATNTRLEEKMLRECLDGILADQKRIADIIVSETSIDGNEAGELFREAKTKDASYALSKGIVHAVEPVSIPKGAPIVTLVIN